VHGHGESADGDQVQVPGGRCRGQNGLGVAPYATLKGRWNSKGTLGVGFTLMSHYRGYSPNILTGPSGTTVVLTMGREGASQPQFTLWSNFQGSPPASLHCRPLTDLHMLRM